MTKKNIQNSALQPNITVPTYTSPIADDEIDLRELFGVIWAYKWLTVALCTLAIIGSVFYALNAQEWWVAKGKIIKPQLNDVASLYLQTNVSSAVLSQSGVSVSGEFKNLFEPNNLFENFLNEFNSSSNKKSFLSISPVFMEFLNKKEIDNPVSTNVVLNGWMKEIKLVKNKLTQDVELSFRGPSQSSSASLLESYIQFVSTKVKNNQVAKFLLFVEMEKKKLNVSLSITKERTREGLARSLKNTEYAYQIAKKADLNSYKTNINQKSELFEISSGKKALKAKIEVLKSIDDLSLLNGSISTMEMALVNISKLNFVDDESFTPFRYLDIVEEPLNRAAPKRALIVILSTLLAGMLSIFIALMHYFMTKKSDE